eukprot:scaffold291143_cov44-Prasinocladus_malaysianus.AAC.3
MSAMQAERPAEVPASPSSKAVGVPDCSAHTCRADQYYLYRYTGFAHVPITSTDDMMIRVFVRYRT